MTSRIHPLLSHLYIALLTTLFILFALVPVWAADDVAASPRQTVRVGFFKFDGYHMVDADGNRSGYGYEALQMLARYNNWTYEYIGYENGWDDMLRMLKDGQIDMVTSAQRTPRREQDFLISERSIGTSMTIFSVRAGDSRFVPEDYSTYSGIRVGLLLDSSRNDSFARFAAAKGFTYEPVYFEDLDSLRAGLLETKTVDAIVTSNLRTIHDEWILEQFDPSPFYVLVRRDEPQLLANVDRAIDQMDILSPGWRSDLMTKFYLTNSAVMLA